MRPQPNGGNRVTGNTAPGPDRTSAHRSPPQSTVDGQRAIDKHLGRGNPSSWSRTSQSIDRPRGPTSPNAARHIGRPAQPSPAQPPPPPPAAAPNSERVAWGGASVRALTNAKAAADRFSPSPSASSSSSGQPTPSCCSPIPKSNAHHPQRPRRSCVGFRSSIVSAWREAGVGGKGERGRRGKQGDGPRPFRIIITRVEARFFRVGRPKKGPVSLARQNLL